jgi:hypothetical protein
LGSDEGRFGERVFHFLRWILPLWPNFEEFHAVSRDSIAEIEFLANMRRRATAVHEFRHGELDTLPLDVVERHG